MVNYYYTAAGELVIEHVCLIDRENAYPVKDGQYAYSLKIGHPFWRSPEALVGRMIGKPTDTFSFGLIVSFTGALCVYLCADYFGTGCFPPIERKISYLRLE